MLIHRRLVIPALLVLFTLLAACVVREELTVDANGAGTATLTINLNPILLSYYSDLLTAMTGVPGDYPVFDLEQLAAAFDQRPGIDLVSMERPARGQLRMNLVFDDLNSVAAAGPGGRDGSPLDSDVFAFRREGSRRELTVRLDRAAVDSLLSFAPPESTMMTEFLFPPDDGSVGREEYRDELAWALEEYAPVDEVERVLDNARIEVVIRPAGRIESQTGGTIRGDTVVFTVSVLDVLTLEEERLYRLVFVP